MTQGKGGRKQPNMGTKGCAPEGRGSSTNSSLVILTFLPTGKGQGKVGEDEEQVLGPM